MELGRKIIKHGHRYLVLLGVGASLAFFATGTYGGNLKIECRFTEKLHVKDRDFENGFCDVFQSELSKNARDKNIKDLTVSAEVQFVNANLLAATYTVKVASAPLKSGDTQIDIMGSAATISMGKVLANTIAREF